MPKPAKKPIDPADSVEGVAVPTPDPIDAICELCAGDCTARPGRTAKGAWIKITCQRCDRIEWLYKRKNGGRDDGVRRWRQLQRMLLDDAGREAYVETLRSYTVGSPRVEALIPGATLLDR